MTEQKTFAGLPIVGYGESPHHASVPQQPIEELEPFLRAVYERDDVEAIRWEQYTPYFNDGEPCYFTVYEPSIKLVGASEDEGDWEDGFVESYSSVLRGGTRVERDADGKWVEVNRGAPAHPVYEDFRELSKKLGSGAFDDALAKLFGDHAQVTVTKTGISVDDYSHD